jgi:hypothetical protein
MGKAERDIEKYLDREIRKAGGFTRKYTSPGRRGVPDRIVFFKGVTFVEVKAENGILDPHQTREICRMRDQKAGVAVMSSKTDVDKYVEYKKRAL